MEGKEGGDASSKAIELFLLTDMLSSGKRGMPLLRRHAAAAIVRKFHELPATVSDGREEEEEEDEEQQGEEEDEGERATTIGREEVLRAALESLMD